MTDRIVNETDTVVALPAHDVLGVPHAILPTGLIPWGTLTSAHINHYAAVTTLAHANAGAGGNISCAISADGFSLGLTDSNEEDDKTLCDPGNAVELGELNFDAEFGVFRDAAPAATDSVFNLGKSLTFAPDVPYILIHRVGFDSATAFGAGQEIYTFYVHTDHPQNVHADGAKQKINQAFIKKDALKPRNLAA